ncbi:MAG: hypothetical protein ABGW78_10480 [Pirellulales bacterium]
MIAGFIKPVLRNMVVRTSFTPFLELYRGIYWAITKTAVLLLRRHKNVKAIYLQRGYAKGEWVPGVSDIDLGVIVERLDQGALDAINQTYRRLARFVFVLDDQLDITDEAALQLRYKNPRKRFRLLEGKATWKLLYGKDYLTHFADLPVEDLYGGLYNEFKIWWTMLALPFLQTSGNKQDTVLQNSICYKVICEIIKADLALNHGVLTFRRSEALELALPHMSPTEIQLVQYYKRIAKYRFLQSDPTIVDKTKNNFVNYMNRFHEQFKQHPYVSSPHAMPLVVEGALDELMYGDREQAHIIRLIQHAKNNWRDSYLGAHLACGCYFEIDELLLMLEVDPMQIPSDSELVDLYALHVRGDADLVDRIHIYLLTPNSAFQIDADYNQGWRTILSADLNPEIFSLLGQSQSKLDGIRFDGTTGAPWSQAIADYFLERTESLSYTLERNSAPNGKILQFARIFWKILQCELIYRSVKNQSPCYPLTISAIGRGLAQENMPLPECLCYLVDEYRDAVMKNIYHENVIHANAMIFLRDFATSIRNPISN